MARRGVDGLQSAGFAAATPGVATGTTPCPDSHDEIPSMDTKRLIAFVVLSFAILYGWQHWFAPKPTPAQIAAQQQAAATGTPAAAAATGTATAAAEGALTRAGRIKVKTDLLDAEIDTMGGDLRKLTLIEHGQHDNAKVPFVLFQEGPEHTYVAHTGLISNGLNLPTHRTLFSSKDTAVSLQPGQNSVSVRLDAPEVNGIKVAKIYTFKRDSYVIDVAYEIVNGSQAPLNLSAYYSLVRDGKDPRGTGGFFTGGAAFTGPAVYTEEKNYQKVTFSEIDKDKAEYEAKPANGWVAMVQHYFVSAWLMSPNGGTNLCAKSACTVQVTKKPGELYQSAVQVTQPTIAAGANYRVSVPLYAGPQETRALQAAAPGLDLVKDYGIFKVIAQPMFALLDLIHGGASISGMQIPGLGNWGWSIVLFTLLIKLALYPLAVTQYRSMAKMKKLAPRMQKLKEQYGDDRMKFQQAVMELYKSEKANPLSGCLPILIQMPIFMGLFYMLQAVVELRQAPWMLWIHDLSVADPYWVLPILMILTMWIQTRFNPPSGDPMQDRMMKIMPVVFGVMFIWFPAGLVLYYVINNVFSIGQQWYITRKIEREDSTVKTTPAKPAKASKAKGK